MTPLLHKNFPVPTGLGFVLMLAASAAQAQVMVDGARATARQAAPVAMQPSGGPGEVETGPDELAPAMEGDEEYGTQRILYRRSNWEPFSFRLDTGGYYTSNVALVDRAEKDDFFWQTGATLSYTPQLKGGLFGRTLISNQIFRYDEAEVFDFDMLNAQAGFLYAFPRAGTAYDPILGDLLLFADYGYYRISQPWEWGDDDFDNHGLSIGGQKTWRFSRGHSLAFGMAANWSMDASRPEPQRDEYAATLAYRVKWTADFESVLGYRAALYDYTETGRSDFNQIISLGLEYRFTDWLRAGGSISGTFNDSDRDLLDYKVLNTGASVFLALSW